MPTEKIYNQKFTNETPKEFKERTKLGVESGEGNSFNPNIRCPTWEQAPNEKWITQKYCNAYITIGHDRPSHVWSGYGGNAGTECATIDICAGSASNLRTISKTGKKSFGNDQVVGKIFASDASRIYISQQTNIDSNFGLPQIQNPDSTGHAAIGIKSDHIRIIGTTSVRLYAGKGNFQNAGFPTGETNARGEAIKAAAKIEFVAGDIEQMQPLVKGTNLIRCLANIYDHISRINQALLLYDKGVLSLRGAAILNFHPSTPVVTFPDPINIATQIINIPSQISDVINNAMNSVNVEGDKQNFLGITDETNNAGIPLGPLSNEAADEIDSFKTTEFILSRNVYTT